MTKEKQCDYCFTYNDEKLNFCKECKNPLTDAAKQLFPEMVKKGEKRL